MKASEAQKVGVEAWSKAQKATPQRPSGCGRVYIVPMKSERRAMKAISVAIGKRWLPYKTYGVGCPTLYVGYDNGTGRELALGEAFAKHLNEAGISCYCDAVGD